MESNFNITFESEDGYDRVHFCGNIDIHAEEHFRNLGDRIVSNKILFDFSEAGRINSMGVAFLLRCMKNLRERSNAEIRVCGLNPVNAMLFKMTGVFHLASLE